MSTFLDRIRARQRRSNARRARRLARVDGANTAPRLEALALDDAQADAIRDALATPVDEAVHDLGADGVDDVVAVDEAEQQGVNETAAALNESPAEVNDQPPAVNAAPPGNPPGDFDFAQLDEVITPTTAGEPAVRLEFKSSNIRSAELGADGVAAVTFKDGAVYRYANFTAELMAEWEAAKSAGSWFHQNVRSKADRHPIVTTQD